MNRWHPFRQLVLARFREFYREPEAVFWVYGFPLILAVGLGIAFSSKKPEPPDVDIQWTDNDKEDKKLFRALTDQRFPGDDRLPVEIHSRAECVKRLTSGKTALFVVPTTSGLRYEYDETRPESILARHWVDALLLRARQGHYQDPVPVPLEKPGSRYIDFLMPGLMGMNLMGGGLWGIGFVLVDMRVRKLLKRYLATPMRRSDFLLSLLTARMFFMVPEMLLLLAVGWFVFGVPIYGDVLTLVLLLVLGAAAFSGIGLLVACRADKTETVSGLMNLVMLPMWLLSGTFFSSRRFPEAAQPFIQALPLTQLNDALREVMLEGGSLANVGWRAAALAAWAVVCFALALRWFRWQ
jgi:ABC-type multidrug transport system permease subunit